MDVFRDDYESRNRDDSDIRRSSGAGQYDVADTKFICESTMEGKGRRGGI